MSTGDITPIELARAEEQIRQERETFDQQKSHVERWFKLRLVMGYSAVVLLGTIVGVSGYILLQPAIFPPAVITAAGAALFADVLGLLVGVWKISLNPDLIGRLSPVTQSELLTPAPSATKLRSPTVRKKAATDS